MRVEKTSEIIGSDSFDIGQIIIHNLKSAVLPNEKVLRFCMGKDENRLML